jgi:ABC-type polysaccharide/polyol phosphate transport system ATPase subunit
VSFAIDVQDLGVQYSLRFTKKTSLRRSFSRMLQRGRGARAFWALRNVTLRIEPGESVGIIGPNGAGKSTLLQVLAGIIQPSEGVVQVNGHVSTLLHLQAGFDQDLSGWENISLAGALMGIDHRVMAARQEDIARFADIGDFINAPLRTYSSGMRAKLGFAIATAVDPDILLLDEVLQTGDEAFREKSRQRVREIVDAAKAMIMVSHDMTWITEFCDRAILLEKGAIVADGKPQDVVDLHLQHSEQRKRAMQEVMEDMKSGRIAIRSRPGRLLRDKERAERSVREGRRAAARSDSAER